MQLPGSRSSRGADSRTQNRGGGQALTIGSTQSRSPELWVFAACRRAFTSTSTSSGLGSPGSANRALHPFSFRRGRNTLSYRLCGLPQQISRFGRQGRARQAWISARFPSKAELCAWHWRQSDELCGASTCGLPASPSVERTRWARSTRFAGRQWWRAAQRQIR